MTISIMPALSKRFPSVVAPNTRMKTKPDDHNLEADMKTTTFPLATQSLTKLRVLSYSPAFTLIKPWWIIPPFISYATKAIQTTLLFKDKYLSMTKLPKRLQTRHPSKCIPIVTFLTNLTSLLPHNYVVSNQALLQPKQVYPSPLPVVLIIFRDWTACPIKCACHVTNEIN